MYSEQMSNRVVHFEIEAADRERAAGFYRQVFGWEMKKMGEDMGNYITVTTGDPKDPGGINGGIYQAEEGKDLNAYPCVISVDDIEKAMEDVKEAGGKLHKDKPDDMPSIGKFARCEDTEGNIFTLMQPAPRTADGNK